MIHVPLARAPIARYDRELAHYGAVLDHFGVGTWTVGSKPRAPIVVERDDHIEVITSLATARAFVPGFLHRVRIELHQQETLAEIFGGSYGTPAQRRIRITLTFTAVQATPARLQQVRRIFGNDGHGGDSEYADAAGVHVWSGILPADEPRIEGRLRRAGLVWRHETETFVTNEAR